jgi:hypothetical protein
MATTPPVQVGTSLLIGMGALTYAGTVIEDVSIEPVGKVEEILDENQVTMTKIISNPGNKIVVSALIKATGFTAPAVGTIVTINSVKYFTVSSSVSSSRGIAKWKFDGIAEAGMTYT